MGQGSSAGLEESPTWWFLSSHSECPAWTWGKQQVSPAGFKPGTLQLMVWACNRHVTREAPLTTSHIIQHRLKSPSSCARAVLHRVEMFIIRHPESKVKFSFIFSIGNVTWLTVAAFYVVRMDVKPQIRSSWQIMTKQKSFFAEMLQHRRWKEDTTSPWNSLKVQLNAPHVVHRANVSSSNKCGQTNILSIHKLLEPVPAHSVEAGNTPPVHQRTHTHIHPGATESLWSAKSCMFWQIRAADHFVVYF